jgi:segregation and condensation protein B
MEQNNDKEYAKLIESALFVAGRALSINDIASTLGVISVGYLKGVADRLVDDYKIRDSPFIINKINEKYELGLRDPYAKKVSSLAGAPDLSKSALRILAYISKNEPVSQSSIVKAFGSSTYIYIKDLYDKDFVKTKKTGRTKILETTERFKEYFNLG